MAIRSDTDPKSAATRSRTPKGELEQYGVWVKAEPQDVIEEAAVPGSDDLDFDLPSESPSLPEESFLTEDEEKLLGTFDADFETPSGYSQEDSGPLPDIEDMPSLEESLLSPEPSPDMEEIENSAYRSIDISLEDIESSRPASPIHPGAAIDMDSLEGLDSPGGAAGAMEDVSSEFLDLPEAAGAAPQESRASATDFGAELDDVTSEFLDVQEAEKRPESGSSSADFEPLDIDLHFEDSPVAEAGFEAVTEFDDFLSSDETMTASPLERIDDGFDDVSAVERELSAPASSPKARQPSVPASGNQDLSTEILLKIAQELASIRGELVSLKTRIGDAMAPAEPGSKKASSSSSEEDADSGPTGGFFDDEEDETIALTGDELDNILNTADFTEEIAETETPIDIDAELPEPASLDDSSLLDETLLPESGDYSVPSAQPAIEEIRIGQADSVDEIGLEYLEGENDVLGLVAEEGLAPMTPAPEDTSYLEATEAMEMGEVNLSDAPLVEPDLSDFELEPEEFEPRLEIDEELPLASSEAAPEVEDITLGMEAGPGYAAEDSAAEAEFLEPISEIEEPNFSEINLHEEGLDSSSASEPSELEEIDSLSDSDFGASLQAAAPQTRRDAPPIEEEEDLVLGTEDEKVPPPSPARDLAAPRAAPKAPPAEAKGAPPERLEADGDRLKSEIKSVLSYLDKLLDSLPEEKIEEFANSEYFDTYKKLFEELGLV